MIHPLKFQTDVDPLTIRREDLELLKKEPQQVLWVRNGVYGLIPIETIRRVVGQLSTSATFMKLWWGEVVVIPEETGRTMAEFNGDTK